VANFEVISAVSETLRSTLETELEGLIVDFFEIGQPPAGAKLTIFLIEVSEDPTARNRASGKSPSRNLTPPSMPLLLRYLITPWGADERTREEILGRAMQAFHAKPVLSGSDLRGTLAGTNEQLRITLSPQSFEERTRVWQAIQSPYHLSLAYDVRGATLDPGEL